MRKLVCVLLFAAACGSSSSDPQITAIFSVYSGGPSGIVLCQPVAGRAYRGEDFVRVNARLTGTQGAGFSDVYPCDVDLAVTPPLTTGPGSYDVWVDYGSDRNSPNISDWVITDTTETVTVLVDGDFEVDVDLRLDNGYLEANWTIDGATCDATTPSVSLLSTVTGPGTSVEDLYNCVDGNENPDPVITSPTLLGGYTVHAAALNAQDQQIGPGTDVTVDADGAPIRIIEGNDYVDLGFIDIDTIP